MGDSNGAEEVCLKEDKDLSLWILLTFMHNNLGKRTENVQIQRQLQPPDALEVRK